MNERVVEVSFALRALRLPPESQILDFGSQWSMVPLAEWLRGPLRGFPEKTLLSERAASRGLFRPGAIRRLVRDHLAGARDHSWKLWSLLSVGLWHRVWIDGDGGGKDLVSRIHEIRHELCCVHGMIWRTVHGREVRFPAIGGWPAPAQVLSVLQRGLSPSARPMARGPVWTFPFIIRRSIRSQSPRWAAWEMLR